MAQTTKHIEVWYDDTSDHQNPAHIVSLEDGDVTTTLAIFPPTTEGYAAALARANQEATKRGLTVEAE